VAVEVLSGPGPAPRSPRVANRDKICHEHLEFRAGALRDKHVRGVFPNDAAVIRLVRTVLAHMHDEWQSGERRQLSEGSMAQLKTTRDTGAVAAIDSGE
jgi:Transposase, Mutator family